MHDFTSLNEYTYVSNTPFSPGFWLKENFYEETPDVKFKRQLLVVIELENEGDFLTYSTYQRYNQLQQQNLRVPLIQVSLFIELHVQYRKGHTVINHRDSDHV